jgi:hypothetical protein
MAPPRGGVQENAGKPWRGTPAHMPGSPPAMRAMSISTSVPHMRASVCLQLADLVAVNPKQRARKQRFWRIIRRRPDARSRGGMLEWPILVVSGANVAP